MDTKPKNKKPNITIAGSGYVGMSLAILLAKKNNITIHDIDENRINLLNNNKSTIRDKDIEKYISNNDINLFATSNIKDAYHKADYVIVATPTDYNSYTNMFDTSSVDSVIESVISENKHCSIAIRSTVPVGYTKSKQEKYSSRNIFFSPEFLREGLALYDNLHPSRIIIGGESDESKEFADILKESAEKKDIQTLFVQPSEAESIKLFSNTYLAMRISFFNELDSFAMVNNLNSKEIIRGVSLDERIGDGYNNPSFGYGGYCLPKDTKQLLNNYEDINQTLIEAIVSSNEERMNLIAEEVIKANPMTVGIYRLVMKKNSDNFRSSAITGVIDRIKKHIPRIIIYEPLISNKRFEDIEVVKDIDILKKESDLILMNRKDSELDDVKSKLFSRDIFEVN